MARGKLRPTIITWSDLLRNGGVPSFPDLRLVAEGDSWFTISGLPAFNPLFELRFHKQTQIVNCGMPGDTIKNMSRSRRTAIFVKLYRREVAAGTPFCSAAVETI